MVTLRVVCRSLKRKTKQLRKKTKQMVSNILKNKTRFIIKLLPRNKAVHSKYYNLKQHFWSNTFEWIYSWFLLKPQCMSKWKAQNGRKSVTFISWSVCARAEQPDPVMRWKSVAVKVGGQLCANRDYLIGGCFTLLGQNVAFVGPRCNNKPGSVANPSRWRWAM